MPEFNYRREIELGTKLARQAGAVLLQHYYSPFLVEQKINALQETEEVTAADREANELIVNSLREAFPNDGILAEESTDDEQRLAKDRVWLIDPMDGTKNFIQRDGDFAVQIGLAVSGESVAGAYSLEQVGTSVIDVRNGVASVQQFELRGPQTNLHLAGSADLRDSQPVDLKLEGNTDVCLNSYQCQRNGIGIQPVASQSANGARRERVWFYG